MAHGDSLIFVNLVFWAFFLLVILYIFFNVNLIGNFYKKIRTRFVFEQSLFQVNIALVEICFKVKFFFTVVFSKLNQRALGLNIYFSRSFFYSLVENACVRAQDVVTFSALCLINLLS